MRSEVFASVLIFAAVASSAPLEEVNNVANNDAQNQVTNKTVSGNEATAPKQTFQYSSWGLYPGQMFAAPSYPQQQLLIRPSSPINSQWQLMVQPFPAALTAKSTEGKTFGHLRHKPSLYYQAAPQYYAAPPQYYAAPAQTYAVPEHGYSSIPYQSYQSYQSSPAYVSYSYPTHSGVHYRSAEADPSLQQQQQPQLTEPCADQLTNSLERLESAIKTAESMVAHFRQEHNELGYEARDANSAIADVTAIPFGQGYSQMDDLRKRDILIDDKFNMQIKPTYLMDRFHFENPQPYAPYPKDAEQSSFDDIRNFGGQSAHVPSVNTEDQVYVVMNPYDNVHGAGARLSPRSASAAWYDQPTAFSQALGAAQPEVAPVTGAAASIAAGPTNQNAPFSPENIQEYMYRAYSGYYAQQLANANKQFQASSQSKSADETANINAPAILNEVIRQMEAKGRSSAADSAPKDIKDETLKKEEKKSDGKTDKPKQS